MIKTEPFSESKLLKIRDWFNVKLDWEPGNSKRLQNHWLGRPETPWEPGGLKTLQKQWFGSLEVPKPYKNNGLGAWTPQNLTKTMVWEPPGFQSPPPPLCRGGGTNPGPWIIYDRGSWVPTPHPPYMVWSGVLAPWGGPLFVCFSIVLGPEVKNSFVFQ